MSSLLRKFAVTHRHDLVAAWWAVERSPTFTGRPPVGALPEPFHRLLSGVFVGRPGELLALHESFARARARRPQIALVAGETGIGKSRLLAEFAASLGRTATIRLGRCDDQPGPPYQPIAEILLADFRERSDVELVRLVGRDAPWLVALVPELAARLPETPLRVAHAGSGDRHAMFEAVRRYLTRVAELRPLVMVLEDAHWADDAVIALVRHLGRHVEPVPLLILVSVRAGQLPECPPRSLLGLRRAPEFTEIEVGPLSRHAVISMAKASDLENPDELGAWLHERGGGNPFFTLELLRSLDQFNGGPQCDPNQRGRDAVPAAVAELVDERLRRLPERTQSVLEWAAVVGTDFEVDVLAGACGTDAAHVLDALDAVERAGVIRSRRDRPGRFEFSHALVRDAAVERLTATCRLRMHAGVARALLVRHHPGDVVTTAQIAHHLFSAGPAGDWREAAAYGRGAGEIARRAHADEEAARHFQRALDSLVHVPDRDVADESRLRIQLGETQRRAGDQRHRETLLVAAELAMQLEEFQLVADAVLAMVPGGWSSSVGRPDPEAADLARRALIGNGRLDPGRRVRLTAVLAADAMMSGDLVSARQLAGQALEDARVIGDRGLVAFALLRHYWAGWDPDDVGTRRRTLDEVVELGRALDDAELTVYAHACRVDALIESGDLIAATDDVEVVEKRADDVHQALYRWLGPQKRSGLALLRGDLALAEQLGDEARRIGATASSPVVDATWTAQRCLIRLEQGRAAEVVDLATDCAEQLPAFPAWRALEAVLLWQAGDHQSAQQAFRKVVGRDIAQHPRINTWRAGMHCVGTMSIALADQEVARRVYGLLLPSRGVIDWFGGGSFGPTDLILGRLAAFLDDEQAARAHLQASVEMCRRIDARAYLVHSLIALSTVGLDRAAADLLSGEAKELAAAIGMRSSSEHIGSRTR
ncbi:MAG: ATP-binding protein [Ilumatobacteraceae bacterium]